MARNRPMNPYSFINFSVLKTTVISLLLMLVFERGASQILHSENFSVIIDTTKSIKGSITPVFRYRNLKEDFLEIESVSDLSLRFKKHAFTIANKLEFSRFGKTSLYTGGFLYLEYRRLIQNKKIIIEPYTQVQWKEARGLKIKYAGGSNLRYKLKMSPDIGMFLGAGLFYEHEIWNYTGVSGDPEPYLLLPEIQRNLIRGSAYYSLKKVISEKFNLDLSLYYQPDLSDLMNKYRLASSTELIYKLSEHIGLRAIYQNVYDSAPVVPIDRTFHDVSFGLSVTF